MRLLGHGRPYLLLFPSLLLFAVFIFYGTAMVFLQSLDSPGNPGSWSFLNYKKLFLSVDLFAAAILTLKVGVVSTLISLAVGTILTRHIWNYLNSYRWTVPVWLPVLIPHFAAAYLMILMLSQGGWLSGVFYQFKLIADIAGFPVLVNDRYGIGIILTYVWKEVPFVVLMLVPVYHMMDWRYADVIRTLGGGKWNMFREIEWPFLYPVLAETGLILFAFIMSAVEIPYLLGVTYPKMIPVIAFRLFYEGDWSSRPFVMAIMSVFSIIVLVIAIITILVLQSRRYRMMRGR